MLSELKGNLTDSTVWNTGENGDINGYSILLGRLPQDIFPNTSIEVKIILKTTTIKCSNIIRQKKKKEKK